MSGRSSNDLHDDNNGTRGQSGSGGSRDLFDDDGGTGMIVLAGARSQYAVSQDGSNVLVIGPEGRHHLSGGERLQFAGGSAVVAQDALASEPSHHLALHNAATGRDSDIDMGAAGLGSPDYLRWQYQHGDDSSVAIASPTHDVFIKGGGGNDAIQATGGTNVLDGGTGSNFLVGATGEDGGTDTFFTDARGASAVWNTVANFHGGDAATLWGFTPGVSTWRWDGISGADGYKGATLRADVHGTGAEDASIIFAGLSMEQAQRLEVATGTVGENSYLYLHNSGV